MTTTKERLEEVLLVKQNIFQTLQQKSCSAKDLSLFVRDLIHLGIFCLEEDDRLNLIRIKLSGIDAAIVNRKLNSQCIIFPNNLDDILNRTSNILSGLELINQKPLLTWNDDDHLAIGFLSIRAASELAPLLNFPHVEKSLTECSHSLFKNTQQNDLVKNTLESLS